MQKVLVIILIVSAYCLMPPRIMADSPHGKEFKLSCGLCHSPDSWKFDKTIYSFDHNTTRLPLTGQHLALNCRQCHKSLVFSEAPSACVDCHTDMHNQTVGPDCGRCHTSRSWIVENITEMHQRSRFPLTGPHYTTDCSRCHISASQLRFEPLGVECYDCHSKDFLSATNPNHLTGGFSKNCTECHSVFNVNWNNANFNHDLFPLTNGHALKDCSLCHLNGNYVNVSPVCVSCHLANYNSTTNPNHQLANIPGTCIDCHTTIPGWKPAAFLIHDAQYFPVYSGKHAGTWTVCSDCHSTGGSYKTFTCVDCHAHNQPDMDSKHSAVGGYTYSNIPCFECHPTGDVSGAYNHNSGRFPLTGAHVATPCLQCHTNGFAGTPTLCSACHQQNYAQSTNPNHLVKNIPNTCIDCHTTNPGWKPATFAIHNNYYVLTGGHLTASCAACHNGNYMNPPNTCAGCHQTTYNQTNNPNHIAAGIPATCADCHTTNPGWAPATFAIHNNYYPLTGGHTTITCDACHNGNYTNQVPNTCVGCHQTTYNQTNNPNHIAAGIPTTCADCHTTNPGWKPATFTIHNNYYPLTGAHSTITCDACHNGSYNGQLPTACVGCHQTNYNQTTNPNHAAISIPTTCADCHTTNPGWSPATFPTHNNYYVLAGAHTSLSCATCHNGNYNNQVPTTCVGCHQADYNGTTNPNHAAAGFPTDCASCHTQTAWIPSTFNHDAQWFPIYSGSHQGKWTLCSDCHPNPSNFQQFSCTTSCHSQGQTNNEHQGVAGYSYNSSACYSCHPTGGGGGKMNRPVKNPSRKN